MRERKGKKRERERVRYIEGERMGDIDCERERSKSDNKWQYCFFNVLVLDKNKPIPWCYLTLTTHLGVI